MSKKVSWLRVTAFVLIAIAFLALSRWSAKATVPGTAGQGYGAISVDPTTNNIAVGTSSALSTSIFTIRSTTTGDALNILDSNGNQVFRFSADNLVVGGNGIDANYSITTANGGIKAENSSAQPAGYFNSNGGGPALVTNSGKVGIGTTAPAIPLAIGAANSGLWGSSTFLDLYAGGNVAMRVLNNMNVGIGTNTPGYRLDIQGGQINTSGGLCIAGDCKTAWSQISSNLGPVSTGASSVKTSRNVWSAGLYNYQSYSDPNAPTTYGAALGFGSGAGGSGELYTEWSSPYRTYRRSLRDCCENWSSWVRLLDASNDSYAANMNQNVRITDAPTFAGATFNGNVGIGVIPTQKLTVSGNINKPGSWIISDAVWGANTLEVHNSSWDGSSNGNYGGVTGGHGYFYGGLQSGGGGGNEAGSGQLYVAGNSMLMGNVGIGITAPGAKLHLQGGKMYVDPNSFGGTATVSLAVGDTDTGLNSAGDGVLDLWSNNVNTMSIRSGNVGIGTAAPAYKLSVVGGGIGGNYALTPNYADWNSYVTGDGGAAIYNDGNSYKKLMIVGNSSAGGSREVGIWDNLTVNGNLNVSGNATISGTLSVPAFSGALGGYCNPYSGVATYPATGCYNRTNSGYWFISSCAAGWTGPVQQIGTNPGSVTYTSWWACLKI